MQAQEILLVQLYSNGDCLYATAVARQLRFDYPGARITWAVSPGCRQMVEGNPHIDEIWEVNSVPRNDESAFRSFLRKVRAQGNWSLVVVTQLLGANLAHYDGCIRSAIHRGYRYPLPAGVEPVLRLSPAEIEKADAFARRHALDRYRSVLLFEFAPQSGQARIRPEDAIDIARRLAEDGDIALILSSASPVSYFHPGVIDGSVLTLRETAAITHHCDFLIGCSSGITWLSTADAARKLPTVQLLDPTTKWMNPPSRDFRRFGLDAQTIIELYHFDRDTVVEVVRQAILDFEAARQRFHQEAPLHFQTTRDIVYNLLCYARLGAILRHIRINTGIYGHRVDFYRELLMGLLGFPFRLLRNTWRKRILGKASA